MELKLCYIWVQEYRNFRNVGFNFCSEQKFEYNNFTKELEVKNIEELPKNFFGNSISEVTGLIGKNGSGKSNILELVCKLLKGGKSALNSPFFIITKENGRLKCYHNSVSVHLRNPQKEIEFCPYEQKIDPLKIVYFSNVYDERVHNFDREVSDISNNQRYRSRRFPINQSTDFEKQVSFIESSLFKKLGMQAPSSIKVASNRWDRSNLNYSIRQRIYGDYYQELSAFLKEFKKRSIEVKDENKFYYFLIYCYFIDTIQLLAPGYSKAGSQKESNYASTLFEHLPQIKERRTEDQAKWMLECMLDVIERTLETNTSRSKLDIESFYQKINYLYFNRSILGELKLKSVSEGIRSRRSDFFIIDYNSLRKNDLEFLRLFENERTFSVDWLGLSSGHKAYLNIFSLLHYELKRIRKENLLICIDEGDLYLHPQWQIEFFHRLINIIPEIYHGKIQLILTSHSPFLLSDLPKQNITIVDPEKEDFSMDGSELEKQTFAGNLYNLYAEPFFLGKDRTSVFAKNKIKELITSLIDHKGAFSEYEKRELTKKINLIGDEIIRLNLLKKLNND